MPFNGSGVFSIVNTFVPNTTILSSAVNQNFTDIASGLSDCLTRDGQAGMTAAIKAISGTAGAPSITFTADLTTGIYLISSGNLGLTSSGVLGFTLDTSQMGIFAQSAAAKAMIVLDTAHASTSANINSLATAGTGAISIGTSTSWATNGYLLCGAEIMSYTVASAAGLTINTRGVMGTTPLSHATASTITQLFSGLASTEMQLPFRATAGRPASPAPGNFGFNTGSAQPEYYNGTLWASVASPNIAPQIRVSPSASTTFITADTTATNLYIYPYAGNNIPVPISGVFTLQQLSTVATAGLTASQAQNGIYDLYAFATSGVLTFGLGPSWSAGTSGSVTAGSCARGTSTGGAALTTAGGFYVNATTMTLLNGATSYSIATASGLLLGSVFIDSGTAGQATFNTTWGQNRRWPFAHAISQNRTRIYLKAGDSTASWTYATSTVAPSNGSTANSLVTLQSVAEEDMVFNFLQNTSSTTLITNPIIGIGYNSTSAYSGFSSPVGNVGSTVFFTNTAAYQAPPALGINIITALQSALNSGTQTFKGTEANMILSANWNT